MRRIHSSQALEQSGGTTPSKSAGRQGSFYAELSLFQGFISVNIYLDYLAFFCICIKLNETHHNTLDNMLFFLCEMVLWQSPKQPPLSPPALIMLIRQAMGFLDLNWQSATAQVLTTN